MPSFDYSFLGNKLTNGRGMSLVEVLSALAIFAVAFTGLLLANQGMVRTVRTAMERDILSTQLQLKAAEVNPTSLAIETAYDVTTKTAVALPNGRQGFFTRLINSAATTPDLKQLNVMLYHKSTDTTPYRQLRKEIQPKTLYYNLGATTYWKDTLGNTWVPWPASAGLAVLTSGSYRNGFTSAGTVANTTFTLASTGTNDTPFTTGLSATGALNLTLMASQNASYRLSLGFVDTTGTTQPVTITVNGTAVETFDLITYSNATTGRSFTRTYVVSPTVDTGGVYDIKVSVSYGGGATNSYLATVALERIME
jgi:prepilin-type N-terminal cleavage/methylation domain-containing protein